MPIPVGSQKCGNCYFMRVGISTATQECHAGLPVQPSPSGWRVVADAEWCALWSDNGTIYTDAAGPVPIAVYSTGDAKLTLKIGADAGFVMMDDGTIGNVGSGASNRANVDCIDLFALLWSNIADADAPVVGGRGASAAADWAALKKITLTKQLGRSIAIAGTGAGLNARTLGHADGAETVGLGVGNLPAAVLASSGLGVTTGDGSGGVGGAGAGGAATPIGILDPRTYWNVMIKL